MKNANDTIGSRTRDFPACSAVPQPTAPPCKKCKDNLIYKIIYISNTEERGEVGKKMRTKYLWEKSEGKRPL